MTWFLNHKIAYYKRLILCAYHWYFSLLRSLYQSTTGLHWCCDIMRRQRWRDCNAQIRGRRWTHPKCIWKHWLITCILDWDPGDILTSILIITNWFSIDKKALFCLYYYNTVCCKRKLTLCFINFGGIVNAKKVLSMFLLILKDFSKFWYQTSAISLCLYNRKTLNKIWVQYCYVANDIT